MTAHNFPTPMGFEIDLGPSGGIYQEQITKTVKIFYFIHDIANNTVRDVPLKKHVLLIMNRLNESCPRQQVWYRGNFLKTQIQNFVIKGR